MDESAEQKPNKESTSAENSPRNNDNKSPLVNGNPQHKLTAEDSRKGAEASNKKQAEKRQRGEIAREIFNLVVKDPEVLSQLAEMGIEPSQANMERAMAAKVARKILKTGNAADFKSFSDEAYGLQKQQNELEISGEISAININVKNYDKKGDDGGEQAS